MPVGSKRQATWTAGSAFRSGADLRVSFGLWRDAACNLEDRSKTHHTNSNENKMEHLQKILFLTGM